MPEGTGQRANGGKLFWGIFGPVATGVIIWWAQSSHRSARTVDQIETRMEFLVQRVQTQDAVILKLEAENKEQDRLIGSLRTDLELCKRVC